MICFIDDHRVVHGVESICRVLPIAPSTHYACLAVRAEPNVRAANNDLTPYSFSWPSSLVRLKASGKAASVHFEQVNPSLRQLSASGESWGGL